MYPQFLFPSKNTNKKIPVTLTLQGGALFMLLVSPILPAGSLPDPGGYDQCLQESMKGITSDRAAAIAEQQHFMTLPESPDNELGHFDNSVGMLADKLLLDRRAVVERLEDKVAHRG